MVANIQIALSLLLLGQPADSFPVPSTASSPIAPQPVVVESPPAEITKPKPIYALTLSATVAPAPDFKTPIPLVPVRLAIIYQTKKITLQDEFNFEKDVDPIETYALSDKKSEIPAGTTIPLPLYAENEDENGQPPNYPTRTPFKTFIRLSGQTVFNDAGFMSQQLLIQKDNNCMIEETKATCSLKIPSVQILAADSPTTKTMEIKIFRKGSVLKKRMQFFPVAKDEQPETYLKKFSRADLDDPRRKNAPQLSEQDLYEEDGTLFGYLLYTKMTFSSELQETDVPVEVKENGYPWKSFQYSKKQSVGRIALLPGVYRIERTLEVLNEKGQPETKVDQTTCDLSKWGEFVPADKLVWSELKSPEAKP